VRAIKTGKSPLKLARKEHDIAAIRLSDQGYTLNSSKIRGFGETYSYPMPGISAVSYEKITVDLTYTRILNSEFLILSENAFSHRRHKGFGVYREIAAVFASCQSQYGTTIPEM
jgi:hypothetical protein